MTINFTINDDYVITQVDIDGVSYDCSIQIDSTWNPDIVAWSMDADENIMGITICDQNNEENIAVYGNCIIDEEAEPLEVEVSDADTTTDTSTNVNPWWYWVYDWHWGN